MTNRHIKLLAIAVGAGFCMAAFYVVYWSFTAPYDVDSGAASDEADGQVEREAVQESLPPLTLQDFEPLWGRKFRPPLADSQPAPSAKPTPPPAVVAGPPPQLDLELVGTIIEPGRAKAVFSDSKGKILLGAVGDSLGEGLSQIAIEQIEARSVVVRHSGTQITLELKRDEKADVEQGLDAPRNP